MNLEDFEDFIGFTKKMVTLLKLKEPKYHNKWKTCPLTYLKHKLDYQTEKNDNLFHNLQNFIPPNTNMTKIELRNTLLDIANLCFFLYNRLGE